MLLMTMKVLPTLSRPPIFPSTVKVALPVMVTPFATTSSALELLRLALKL